MEDKNQYLGGKGTSQIPVVSVVGKSGSGKTTLLERLIGELTSRGWNVGTVKHHIHDFDIDVPGKDSWRHAQAGAVVTMISSPDKFALIKKVERERTLDELVALADDVDILLTEGFKRAGDVRIEVSRLGCSDEATCEPSQRFALVTDNPALDAVGKPVFGLDDVSGVADLIEREFLGRGGEQ